MTLLRYGSLGAALFVYLTAELFPIGAQSELAAGLACPPARIGLLLSVYAVVAGAVTLPLLAVTRRYDQRTVLVVCVSVLAVSQVGFAFSDDFASAAAWRAPAAAVHGIVWSQATVVAARLSPPNRVARASAAVFVGSTLALVAGAPLTATLAHVMGWRATSMVIGVAAAVCAAALCAVLPSVPPHRASPPATGGAGDVGPIALVGSITVLMVTGHYVSYAFFEPLVLRGGFGYAVVAPMLAAFGIAGLLGVCLAGRRLDAHPRRVRFGVVTGLVCALFAVAIPPVIPAGVVVWGCAAAAMPVVLNTAALRSSQHRKDVASAVYVVAYQAGIAIGSATGAAVLDFVSLAALPIVSIMLIVASAALPFRTG